MRNVGCGHCRLGSPGKRALPSGQRAPGEPNRTGVTVGLFRRGVQGSAHDLLPKQPNLRDQALLQLAVADHPLTLNLLSFA